MTYPVLLSKQLSKDAPYSWFLFDQAKHNPRYYYRDFREQASRVESYLDALVVAYKAGDDIADGLSEGDWGVCFVLASLGIGLQDSALFQNALDQLDEHQETHYRELVDACLWYQCDDLSAWVLRLSLHPSPVAQQSALALARVENINIGEEPLKFLFKQPHPAVKSQLLHWIGEQGNHEQEAVIKEHYSHADPQVAFAAARAGFLLSDIDAKPYLERAAFSENPHMREAIALLFIQQQDPIILNKWLTQLWDSEQITPRIKAYAIAVAGLSSWVEQLLELMEDDTLSRAAGEAFTLITGVDLEDADLDDDEPECSDCELLAKQKEEEQAAAPKDTLFTSPWEQDLPLPNIEAIYEWWQTQESRFINGERYLAGQLVSEESVNAIFQQGNQSQRHIAAQHLSLRFEYPWMNVNAC